jgi:hypothetical protein
MDFTCDIYAYESDMGYQVHIATRRRMGPQPYVPWSEFLDKQVSSEELWEAYRIYSDAIDSSGFMDIGLEFDGQSFCYGDPRDFYDAMIEFREMGYNFPDEALEMIREDIEMSDVNKVSLNVQAYRVVQTVLSKNKDYGDAYKKKGIPGILVRLSDKATRVENLQGKEALVVSESVEDTLVDIAGYALLGLIELQAQKKESSRERD